MIMIDLTKITTPFGLLDKATQEALKEHGGPYQVFSGCGWVLARVPTWQPLFTYRVAPTPQTKPNVELIDEVIAAIKEEKLAKLDLRRWFDDKNPYCGTTACIGGFIELIQGNKPTSQNRKAAAASLGISEHVAGELFFLRRSMKIGFADITSEIAVRALEDLKTDSFTLWDDYIQ